MDTASENPTRSYDKLWPRRRLVVIAVGLLAFFALFITTPRHDSGWIDPNTGSMKTQTCWFGFLTSTNINRSAIENWLIRHEGSHVNEWSFLYKTGKTVWGRPVEFGCGQAPPIYVLNAGELNDEFVRLSTDQEIAEFLRVMRSGTDAEKSQAVKTACERTLERLDSPKAVH